MPIYDSMTPFEAALEDQQRTPERPILQLATPEATPTKVHYQGFDWNQWEGPEPGWHTQIEPASPQSLPYPDYHPTSPTSEALSPLPNRQKCGLTTKQHREVQAFICGHICRDIPLDSFCPDIDAPRLSDKDCPIHHPKTPRLSRRRSSLSKPPMLARDESSYNEMNAEKQSNNVATSTNPDHAAGEKPVRKAPLNGVQSTPYETPLSHVSHSPTSGDADF